MSDTAATAVNVRELAELVRQINEVAAELAADGLAMKISMTRIRVAGIFTGQVSVTVGAPVEYGGD